MAMAAIVPNQLGGMVNQAVNRLPRVDKRLSSRRLFFLKC